MRTQEYQNYKSHILNYMTKEDLKANLNNIKADTWHAAYKMAEDGFFACYYNQVLEAFKDIYGEDYKATTYETKSG